MSAVRNNEFFLACKKGNVDVVAAYLKGGGDANARDEFRFTGLIWAARNGHVPVADILIEAGATIDAGDVRGRTALFHAVTFKQYDLVDFLAKAGANINPLDSHGCTPLDVSKLSSDTKMVRVLQDLGGVARYTSE